MTAYTLQSPAHAGTTLTATAPAASANTAPCGNGVALYIVNPTGGTSVTVTVAIPAVTTHDGLTISARALTVAAGNGVGVLPLVPLYVDPATGLCSFGVTGTLTNVLCFVTAIGS